jgi:hypothetical protein
VRGLLDLAFQDLPLTFKILRKRLLIGAPFSPLVTIRRKPYQTEPKEFKLEALHMLEESDRSSSKIAMRRNHLYKWKE